MRNIMLLLLTITCFSGCTAKAWYEGLKMEQRRQCDNYPQQADYQQCIERANGMTYDQYKGQREEIIKK